MSDGSAVQPATSTTTLPEMAQRAARRWHFVRAALVGCCAGLLAVAFRRGLALIEGARGRFLLRLHGHPHWGWAVLPLIGLLAGSFVGWITVRFAPEAAGSGVPHLKGVLLHVRKLDWRRLIPVKFFGGIIGIGAGLSLGREGPTIQMGAAVAQGLARIMKTPEPDLPQLFSAGAGAGLAAAFNAPLAGLLFVIEELHRELSSRTAAGALVAAVCATVVTQWLAGDTPSFQAFGVAAMPLRALPLAFIIGIIGGAVGVAFNKCVTGARRAGRSTRLPHWLLPGLAGLLGGIIAWWLPAVLGGGQALGERLLAGEMAASVTTLALILVGKLLFTAICYGSGAPGGIFAPMLLLGAISGTLFARLAAIPFPHYTQHTQILAVLGMAGVFVGSVRAPLTGIVLISEMTGGYDLLFPICISGLAAYLVAEAMRDRPVYDALLEADLQRTGHGPRRARPRNVYIGVQGGSPIANRTVAQAGLPRGALLISIERAGTVLLPTAQTVLLPGDHLSILTPGDEPDLPMRISHLCTGL